MSIVHYKFKSAKTFDTVTFDGTGISVFDLKREIMLAKKLGKGTDFDLAIFNAQTNEEYADDQAMIQRNSSILVARQPPARPGKGTAQRYLDQPTPTPLLAAPGPDGATTVGGTFHNPYAIHAAGAAPRGPTNGAPATTAGPSGPADEPTGEDERIKRMFAQSEDYWKQTERKMEYARYIPYQSHRPRPPPTAPAAGAAAADGPAGPSGRPYHQIYQPDYAPRPPPPGYICYRCGERGHWIQQCPKANDPDFENKPKLKRTTGIPRSFLKTVAQPESANQGLLVTGTGELVMQVANDRDWKRQTERTRQAASAALSRDADAGAPPDLQCRICNKLVRDAVTLPCCDAHFCDSCLRWWLLENPDATLRTTCPACGTAGQTLDRVQPAHAVRARVAEHLGRPAPAARGARAPTPPQPRHVAAAGPPARSGSLTPPLIVPHQPAAAARAGAPALVPLAPSRPAVASASPPPPDDAPDVPSAARAPAYRPPAQYRPPGATYQPGPVQAPSAAVVLGPSLNTAPAPGGSRQQAVRSRRLGFITRVGSSARPKGQR